MVVHDEIVPARAPWLHHIAADQTLRIIDLEGNQAVDFLIYSAADDAERYSAQDTVAAQGNLFLRTGTVLRSPRRWYGSRDSRRRTGCARTSTLI